MARHAFWAKLDRSCEPLRFHPLPDHCVDVAFVLRRLVDQPGFSRGLTASVDTALTSAQRDRLAAIALLHDIGKCNWGFQAKSDPHAHQTAGHVTEAVSLLCAPEIRALWPDEFTALVTEICGWFEDADAGATALLLAALSHHGRPVRPDDARGDRHPVRWWRPRGAVHPMLALAELARTARRALPSAFGTAPAMRMPPQAQQRFAGLVMLADWIGSDTRHFPFRDDPGQDRVAFAASQAGCALAAIGLVPPAARVARPFDEAFSGRQPTPLQHWLSTGQVVQHGSRVVVVESETCSGKTEAALAWFFRLFGNGTVDSLYFALPTRVAAREIHERVLRALEAAFPVDHRPGPVLLAAPGYVRIDGQPLLPQPDGTLWEDSATERRLERQWSASHPKRFLAAPVAVGAVDQALLSVLKVKHALLRSVCLDRSLLVVDEVHASDPYMRQLLQHLVSQHTARGGQVLLLSVTLGDTAASAFLNLPALPLEQAERLPYPAVRTASGVQAIASTGRSKTVVVGWIDGLGDADVLPELRATLQQGARVLVVCNTVARANALLRAVEAAGGFPPASLLSVNGVFCPHHGRFARAHRELMDAEIGRRLGFGSPGGAQLLIGTQTLEQSLDIDADFLVTDLCPMDVLLQRIGRLHRHHRPDRPAAFAAPRVLIRVPLGPDLSSLLRGDGEMRAPAGLGTVYPDGRVLQRTVDELRERGCIEIPRDNRALVERSTHPQALARLGEVWRQHGSLVEGRALAMRRIAETSANDDRLPFGELRYGAPDESITTRLGVDTWRLPLTHAVGHPFGVPLVEIDLPGRLAPPGVTPPDAIEADATPQGLRFAIGPRHYRYTRFGLERDDDA